MRVIADNGRIVFIRRGEFFTAEIDVFKRDVFYNAVARALRHGERVNADCRGMYFDIAESNVFKVCAYAA